jgi:hypothetical protein
MKASEYRANAEAAVKLAAKSDDDDYKAIMLEIAQGWLDLAERAAKSEQQPKERRTPTQDRRH